MTEKQAIKFWASEAKRLNRERKRLRLLLNRALENIHREGQGHTPDWHLLAAAIEAYEDDYAPLGDNF